MSEDRLRAYAKAGVSMKRLKRLQYNRRGDRLRAGDDGEVRKKKKQKKNMKGDEEWNKQPTDFFYKYVEIFYSKNSC